MNPDTIYSIRIDAVNSANPNIGFFKGETFDVYQAHGTSDSEMIAQGFVRVECNGTDGMETIWAELWEINNVYRKVGQPLIKSSDICI